MEFLARNVAVTLVLAGSFGAVVKTLLEHRMQQLTSTIAAKQVETILSTFCIIGFTFAIVMLRSILRQGARTETLRLDVFARDLEEELSCQTQAALDAICAEMRSTKLSQLQQCRGGPGKISSPETSPRRAQDFFTRSMMIDYLAERQGYRRVFIPGEGWLGKRQLEELRAAWGINEAEVVNASLNSKAAKNIVKQL